MTVEVKFLRVHVTAQQTVTDELIGEYRHGWRVVSHTESDDEYTFVLERKAPPDLFESDM